jgi:hypothetical protein
MLKAFTNLKLANHDTLIIFNHVLCLQWSMLRIMWEREYCIKTFQQFPDLKLHKSKAVFSSTQFTNSKINRMDKRFANHVYVMIMYL